MYSAMVVFAFSSVVDVVVVDDDVEEEVKVDEDKEEEEEEEEEEDDDDDVRNKGDKLGAESSGSISLDMTNTSSIDSFRSGISSSSSSSDSAGRHHHHHPEPSSQYFSSLSYPLLMAGCQLDGSEIRFLDKTPVYFYFSLYAYITHLSFIYLYPFYIIDSSR
eukprot:TRINITY_DN5990_c0_g1_i2.p1 TRINITY_DN5990_c0_g1~~TRINITY_DN5990_c0_g1_i2.p1  ORF type:complete len:162 (-),score=49.69 TRINITY_DN5990_c0_g1_i2:321-806(-)